LSVSAFAFLIDLRRLLCVFVSLQDLNDSYPWIQSSCAASENEWYGIT